MITVTAVDCAWCMVEQGLDLGNGSHGICDDHAAQMLIKRQDQLKKRYDELLNAYKKTRPYVERGNARGYGGY